MKTNKLFSLTELSIKELDRKQMKSLKGGDFCAAHCGTQTPEKGSIYEKWRAAYEDR